MWFSFGILLIRCLVNLVFVIVFFVFVKQYIFISWLWIVLVILVWLQLMFMVYMLFDIVLRCFLLVMFQMCIFLFLIMICGLIVLKGLCCIRWCQICLWLVLIIVDVLFVKLRVVIGNFIICWMGCICGVLFLIF